MVALDVDRVTYCRSLVQMPWGLNSKLLISPALIVPVLLVIRGAGLLLYYAVFSTFAMLLLFLFFVDIFLS